MGAGATCVSGGVAALGAQRIWERRVYEHGSALPPRENLQRSGIRPVSIERTKDGTVYLIPFATLEARAKAWDRFNTGEDWCTIRDAGGVLLREIRVYAAS